MLGVLVVLSALAWALLPPLLLPTLVRHQALPELEQALGLPVAVERVRVSRLGTIRFLGVRVGAAGDRNPSFFFT